MTLELNPDETLLLVSMIRSHLRHLTDDSKMLALAMLLLAKAEVALDRRNVILSRYIN